VSRKSILYRNLPHEWERVGFVQEYACECDGIYRCKVCGREVIAYFPPDELRDCVGAIVPILTCVISAGGSEWTKL